MKFYKKIFLLAYVLFFFLIPVILEYSEVIKIKKKIYNVTIKFADNLLTNEADLYKYRYFIGSNFNESPVLTFYKKVTKNLKENLNIKLISRKLNDYEPDDYEYNYIKLKILTNNVPKEKLIINQTILETEKNFKKFLIHKTSKIRDEIVYNFDNYNDSLNLDFLLDLELLLSAKLNIFDLSLIGKIDLANKYINKIEEIEIKNYLLNIHFQREHLSKMDLFLQSLFSLLIGMLFFKTSIILKKNLNF